MELWEDLRIQAHERYLGHDEEMLRYWKGQRQEYQDSLDRAISSIDRYERSIDRTKTELAEQYKLRGY